ncbi:MAG: S9 family peptidase, partial [Muribaculaceae bacterium]|nr:S9 family peptidase [Muribaculaceae bacterium]
MFDLSTARETVLTAIEGYIFSPDKTKILVWTDQKPIYRRSSSARYFVYEIRSRLLRPLSPDMEQTQSPVFSYDGRMVAFVYENNIYIKKIDFNSVVQVTKDGEKGKIINGAVDWTYEEEFTMTSSLAFAPDNSTLCYVKTNEIEVPSYSLTLYKGTCDPKPEYALYPGRFTYKYPVAGETNSKVSVHSYEIDTRKTKDLAIPDTRVEYIPRIHFGDTGEKLLVSTLNRDQNHFEIYSINPKTGVSKSLYSEDSKAWITPETYEKLKIENDGFVILSSKSGRARLYKYSYAGSLIKTLTPETYDALDYYGTDAMGAAYYQAAAPTPIDRTVYKVDSKGLVTAVSPTSGSSRAVFAPGCAYAMMVTSDINTPPCYSIVDSKGQKLRILEKNEEAMAKKSDGTIKEFLKVPGASGEELNAYLVKPRDFDSSWKYPVVMYQYSGPGSQTVINEWHHDWQNYFASKGFLVFCVDGRGTGGRGTAFMYSVYRNLGQLETQDQIAAARWLGRQSWVDQSRIGMHGWSFGGYETLMC